MFSVFIGARGGSWVGRGGGSEGEQRGIVNVSVRGKEGGWRV